MKNSWKPTRKWIARTIVGLIGVATMYVTTGTWDTEESLAILTLVAGASTSYLLPNAEDNTGVETPVS